MAELSKLGSGKSVLTFSASSNPWASSSVSSIGSMEPMPSSTIDRCSSTVRRRSSSATSASPRCSVALGGSAVLGLILPQPGPEVGSDVGVSDGELHDGLDVLEPITGVVAPAAEDHAVHRNTLAAEAAHG